MVKLRIPNAILAAYIGREPPSSRYRNDDPIEAHSAEPVSFTHPLPVPGSTVGRGQGHTDELGRFTRRSADHSITSAIPLLLEPQTDFQVQQ